MKLIVREFLNNDKSEFISVWVSECELWPPNAWQMTLIQLCWFFPSSSSSANGNRQSYYQSSNKRRNYELLLIFMIITLSSIYFVQCKHIIKSASLFQYIRCLRCCFAENTHTHSFFFHFVFQFGLFCHALKYRKKQRQQQRNVKFLMNNEGRELFVIQVESKSSI